MTWQINVNLFKVKLLQIYKFQEIINTDDYKAHNSSGKIVGDSIFYDFEYENFFGEVFWGTANGIKIEWKKHASINI